MFSRLLSAARSSATARQTVRDFRMVLVHRRYGLKHVDRTFYIAGPGHFSRDLIVGPYSYVGTGADFGPGVILGRYVMVADHVAIVGADHEFRRAETPTIFAGRPREVPRTVLDDDVWVGYRVIIMAGVHVGRGAVVAAGSVVTKDIEPYEIVGGNPAKRIGLRFSAADREKHEQMLSRPATLGQYC